MLQRAYSLTFFFAFTLLWPSHYFPCAAVNVSDDYGKQPGRGTLSLLSQLWEGRGSGVSSPQVASVLQTWNTATACDSFWIPGYPIPDISCFWLCGLFQKAILWGQIENNWLECNILQEEKKKLAFGICLHASISLQDISVALKHQCSSPVSGCLFSKVEPSLPKQISTWIMGLAPA